MRSFLLIAAGLIGAVLLASLPARADDPIKMSVVGYAKIPMAPASTPRQWRTMS